MWLFLILILIIVTIIFLIIFKVNVYVIISISTISLILLLLFCMYFYQLDLAQIFYKSYSIIFYTEKEGKLCLTIDDVIYSNSFEEILDILKEYNIKVIFFVISSNVNDNNKHLLHRALLEGHILANHGNKNVRHASLSKSKLESELETCESLLVSLYDDVNMKKDHKYYRPGHGHVSKTVNTYCKENNYTIVLGSVYPMDPQIHDANINLTYINNKVKSGDIIIIHDRKWTPKLLKNLLPILTKKYEFINILKL